MQIFEEITNKTDKVFIMLELEESAMIVDAIESFSKQNPKKKKLKSLCKQVRDNLPYKKY